MAVPTRMRHIGPCTMSMSHTRSSVSTGRVLTKRHMNQLVVTMEMGSPTASKCATSLGSSALVNSEKRFCSIRMPREQQPERLLLAHVCQQQQHASEEVERLAVAGVLVVRSVRQQQPPQRRSARGLTRLGEQTAAPDGTPPATPDGTLPATTTATAAAAGNYGHGHGRGRGRGRGHLAAHMLPRE
eukprot:scaffold3951_cov58-Phaeocystis_antarctica.AAC.2